MQEEKAAGEPSSLEVPVPWEFLRNGRIPKNSQQRPAGCQVASVSQQLFCLLTEWAVSVGMNEEMTKHSVRCCLLFLLTSPPLALLHFFLNLFFIGVQLLYNVLVSAVQCESALSIHMSLSP